MCRKKLFFLPKFLEKAQNVLAHLTTPKPTKALGLGHGRRGGDQRRRRRLLLMLGCWRRAGPRANGGPRDGGRHRRRCGAGRDGGAGHVVWALLLLWAAAVAAVIVAIG
jgi:hypothetical protein